MIKVIIVDDENWNRDIIRRFGDWEALGMEVAGEADDGLEAVRIIEEVSPHLVITDMRMPGVDGVRLLEILSSRFPAIKTIVVSGYDDFAYTKHAIRYKAIDYLLKPVDPKELNAALAKCRTEIERAESERRTATFDLELTQWIASFKMRLRHHFNELNGAGVQGAFGQLEQELELIQDSSPGLLARIMEEMLLYLQELMEANSIELQNDSSNDSSVRIPPASPKEAAAELSGAYMHALDQLVHQRKFKNKLNLEEVRRFIDRHYVEPVTLEQLARIFFVSKEYLSKSFKLEYGSNVTDYLLELRMDKAREWLLDERLSIKAVAEMTGYEDVSYFYRVFKKHFGIAPGEMRKLGEV